MRFLIHANYDCYVYFLLVSLQPWSQETRHSNTNKYIKMQLMIIYRQKKITKKCSRDSKKNTYSRYPRVNQYPNQRVLKCITKNWNVKGLPIWVFLRLSSTSSKQLQLTVKLIGIGLSLDQLISSINTVLAVYNWVGW